MTSPHVNNLTGKPCTLILQVREPDGAVQYGLPIKSEKLDMLLRPTDDAERRDLGVYLVDLMQDVAYGAHCACDPTPSQNWRHELPSDRFEASFQTSIGLIDVYSRVTPFGPVALIRYGNEPFEVVSIPVPDTDQEYSGDMAVFNNAVRIVRSRLRRAQT